MANYAPMVFLKLATIILLLMFLWAVLKVVVRVYGIILTIKGLGSQARRHTAVKDQKLVKCVACHTHIAANEAIYINGKPYCSESHTRGTPT